MIRCERTEFGFIYGAAKVERMCSDDKKGWVYIGVTTEKYRHHIYVTKTGKVRVYRGAKELK